MKIYTLSVNTLTWNLTSERHDNCAPCLGLILPIRWVTPPPNVLFWSVSLMALPCNVFTFGLASISTYLHDYLHYWVSLIRIYSYISVLSSTAFTYSYVFSFWIFWTKWMWSDPNLSMLPSQIYLSKSYAFYWNYRMSSLRPSQQKAQRQTLSPLSMLIPSRRSGNDHPTIQACVGCGTTPDMLYDGHVFLKYELPGAPV